MRKITDYPSTKENPYKLEGIEQKEYLTTENVQIVSDVKTGELYEQKRLSKNKLVTIDTLQFTKVYYSSNKFIKNFSIPAIKVWSFILVNLKPNSNEVYLYMEDLINHTGYSGTSNIYKGIAELLEKDFIARSTGNSNRYWINPNMYFNGNRIQTN